MLYSAAMSKPKRPKDANQLAKLMVDISIGETQDSSPNFGKNPAAVALGRLGGLKGGKIRAERLSSTQRSAIARKAAEARWQKKK